jgi:hypothetical protein
MLNRRRWRALADSIGSLERELDNLRGEPPTQYAPVSEVERLNLAFEELAALRADVAAKAPVSEVERLNLVFRELSLLRSERNVEIPWVLSLYRGEHHVLEVGYAYAERRYVEALRSLSIPFLVGLDLACPSDTGYLDLFTAIRADVRHPVFREGSFQLILCISTIEHIGRDNSGYGLPAEPRSPAEAPDHQTIRQLADWLAPGGRLLLTVPFGKFEDHGWLINYDAEHLDALVKVSGLDIVSARYYEQRGGWVACNRDEVRNRGYGSVGAPNAGAVALLELRRELGAMRDPSGAG